MVYYWCLFIFLMVAAFTEKPGDGSGRISPLLLFTGLLLTISIGLRFEVGGDWKPYIRIFNSTGPISFERALRSGDPAYQAINWVVQQIGSDVWLVNLICAAIFCWGLVRFASHQKRPMLTVLVALPYLIIVVAMGYTRQATAIGILLAGLAAFSRKRSILQFAIYVAVAAAFHKTAIVAFPLAALAGQRSRLVNVLIALSFSFLFYALFLSTDKNMLVNEYVTRGKSSDGAAIRVAMSLLPAIVFLLFRKRFQFADHERAMWRNFALTSVICAIMLVILPSSTAVDRLALYLIPLQLGVVAAIPGVLTQEGSGKLAVVTYALAVQFVWLTYATHARFWLPYQNVLFS